MDQIKNSSAKILDKVKDKTDIRRRKHRRPFPLVSVDKPMKDDDSNKKFLKSEEIRCETLPYFSSYKIRRSFLDADAVQERIADSNRKRRAAGVKKRKCRHGRKRKPKSSKNLPKKTK